LPRGSPGHHETKIKISSAKIWISDESSSGDEASAATKAPVPREKKMPKPASIVEAEKRNKRLDRFAQPAPCEREKKKKKQPGGEHAMKKKSKEMNTQKKSMPLTEVKSKAMKTKKKAMLLAKVKSKVMKKKKRAMPERGESIE
jgi:hypothetical protein